MSLKYSAACCQCYVGIFISVIPAFFYCVNYITYWLLSTEILWRAVEHHTCTIYDIICYRSPRFLCRPTAFFRLGKQRICPCNSALAHFHVSWVSDFIFYRKPLYKSLHQSFFYSFITILPSESGVYTPLQHDFALDPMISSFHFHFGIYKRDLAILTEWWQQHIAWWELLNATRQIICIYHVNNIQITWKTIYLSVFCRTNSSIYSSNQSRRK
jgi:hypothetical protein